jgi:hypothetical protein
MGEEGGRGRGKSEGAIEGGEMRETRRVEVMKVTKKDPT